MRNKKKLRGELYLYVGNINIIIINHELEGEKQFILNVALRKRYCIDNAGEWSPVPYG